jgi:hypothetical protein
MPSGGDPILGAGLNCSESTRVERSPGGWSPPALALPLPLPVLPYVLALAVAGAGDRERSSTPHPHLRVGDTCPEKAFSSQRALPTPIGDTSQRKTLLRQRTARTVLNRDLPKPTPSFGGENRAMSCSPRIPASPWREVCFPSSPGPAQSAGGRHINGQPAAVRRRPARRAITPY